MTLNKKLKRLFSEILKEVDTNPEFAERVSKALGDSTDAVEPSGRSNRREAAVLDLYEAHKAGETALRDRLTALDLEQLRDIVAQYGMDHRKLAMKWKNKSRVLDHIIATLLQRLQHGRVFRGPSED